jgi:hypothetical protein
MKVLLEGKGTTEFEDLPTVVFVDRNLIAELHQVRLPCLAMFGVLTAQILRACSFSASVKLAALIYRPLSI